MVNIETTMEKIARIYSKNSDVHIVIGSNFSSDCKTKITIPPISDQADPWIRFVTEVGVYHEVEHINETDSSCLSKDPNLFKVHNAIEDIRIEKLGARKHAGIGPKQKSFLSRFIKENINARFSNPDVPVIKKILDLVYLKGSERRLGDLGIEVPQDIGDLFNKKAGDLFDAIDAMETNDDAHKIAKELYKRLKTIEPPKPPEQPQQKNQKSQKGEKGNDSSKEDGDSDNQDRDDGAESEQSEGDNKNESESSESGKSEEPEDTDTGREKGSPENSKDDGSGPDECESNKFDTESSNEGKDSSSDKPSDEPSSASSKPKPDPLEKELAKQAKDESVKVDSIGDEIAKTVNDYANTTQIYRVDESVEDVVYKQNPKSYWQDEVGRYESEGRRTTAYLGGRFRSLFISEQAKRWISSQRSGKLDTRKLWNDNSDSIFRKRTEGRREDSAVSLVIDNSGSMKGNKSNVASSILTALAGELDRVRIPFECMGFTSTRNNDYDKNKVGIRTSPIHINMIKSFGESYRRTKYRFVWPSFSSLTVELDCIKYAVNRLIQRRETKKILFVLCDGDVESGSSQLNNALNRAEIEYVKRLEKAGIYVVGFGIQSYTPATFFTNHIIVNELDGFARTFFKELSKILIGR